MNSNAKQVKLTIDGRDFTVDESVTILEAARRNGIDIPTLCHHPALTNWGGCRLCVVEVDKSPKLVASCVMPVRDGMEVVTENATITASRRLSLELLFAERNHNCMFCPDSGDCELQKMAYALQMDHLTVSQSFKAFPTDVTGEYMTFDHNRCILCGRCVRACQEIAGTQVLGFHNRGPRTLIGFDLLESRKDSSCINCGACLQVCPTGAINSRYRAHYAVKGQPAERRTTTSLCAQCGMLCPVTAVSRDNQLIRMEGMLGSANGRPDRGQLCYKGRFEVLKTHGQRLTAPMVKDAQGQWRTQSWERALELITAEFEKIGKRDGASALFGITSAKLSNEALVLFKQLMVDRWGTGWIDTLDGDHFRNIRSSLDNGPRAMPEEVSWKKIAGADMILMVGADPQASHPVLISLLRQALLERKLPVAVIGQARDAHLLSSFSLPVAEEELRAVLFTLCVMVDGTRSVASQGKYLLKAEQQTVLNHIAQTYGAAASPLILAGEKLTGRKAAGGLAELFKLLRIKSAAPAGAGAGLVLLKPSVNSAAAWRLGLASPQGPNEFAGAGLLVLEDEQGENLDTCLKSRTAPDFLAVVTPYYDPGLASAAHVLLPRPLWLEEDGSYTSPDGAETLFKPGVLDPPAGVLRTWEILQGLALRKGGAGQARNWESLRADAGKILEALQR
ncbi:MAG: 4Fe-4S dicluster domain-containing protein [Desulfobacteraceae bacterium]|nr:MAG: 4Fe-4S dicluster domain-containing protein [Desulfobacteraceae bacterium]